MEKQKRIFRLNPIHFCLFFFILGMYTYTIERIESLHSPIQSGHIPEIEDISFFSFPETSFILFHQGNSPTDQRMESILEKWQQSEKNPVHISKVDVLKNEEIGVEYRISGTPCIVICKNGFEVNRILGVVPLFNLKSIYKRMN
ncbi:MAG: thioredoxin family protein [Tannerellaceae bacterium]|nr:thioredoxin family protein [Tannerellaceae bacterium]